MKKIVLLVPLLIIPFVLWAQSTSFETATQAVQNMKVGWNLGNTLEAHKKKPNPDLSTYWGQEGLESENNWGQSNTKPELLKMMKEAGFGAIRMPVTWYNHMDAEGNVDSKWMARVKEVVGYVLDQGMYCIVNVHHDTGADETGEHVSWIKAEGANFNKNKARFEKLWKQIATEFKDYDQKLLFESYNEMLDKYSSWNYATSNRAGGYLESEAKDAYDAINNYAQSFVNVVRETGGNNAQRNLVVNTYGACSGGKWGSNELPMEPLRQMKLPTDVTSNHLIFQIHSYPGLKSNNLASIKSQVTTMMSDLKNILTSKGAPVIIGEWGTINDDSDVNYNDNKTNYLEFCNHFVTEAKDNGMCTFYWMGLSDGPVRSLPVFSQPDLAECILKAYYGSYYSPVIPTLNDVEYDFSVSYTKQWAEANLSNSTLTLSQYKGIRIELAEKPLSGNLQLKVYGEGGKEQYNSLTEATTTINFNKSTLGSTVSRITLQYCKATYPYQVRVKSAMLIKTDGTEIKTILSTFWGCSVELNNTSGINTLTQHPTNLDNYFYTLDGRCVVRPKKGVYIRNGKKVVIK